MHRGFITLHRKIVEWEWYSDANAFRVFTHLILTANWESKKWQGILVERGQKITSIQHIAEETGLTPQSVRTAISKLKLTGELTSQSTNKYTIVTLTNYDFYQTRENEITSKITSAATSEEQTANKPITTTKQLNNITIQQKENNTLADFKKTAESIIPFLEREGSLPIEPTKNTKEKKEKKPDVVFEIPDELNTPDFLKLWQEWQSHLKEKKAKTTSSAFNKQLTKLAGFGLKKAIHTLNHCIEKNWQGIYEDPVYAEKERKQAEADAYCADGPSDETLGEWEREIQEIERNKCK